MQCWSYIQEPHLKVDCLPLLHCEQARSNYFGIDLKTNWPTSLCNSWVSIVFVYLFFFNWKRPFTWQPHWPTAPCCNTTKLERKIFITRLCVSERAMLLHLTPSLYHRFLFSLSSGLRHIYLIFKSSSTSLHICLPSRNLWIMVSYPMWHTNSEL